MPINAIIAARWFGILTSISPCPLATNIAAIGFVARHTGRLHSSLLAGLLYTIGRTIAYLALGVLIMSGLFATGQIALFLQQARTSLRHTIPRRNLGAPHHRHCISAGWVLLQHRLRLRDPCQIHIVTQLAITALIPSVHQKKCLVISRLEQEVCA